MARIRKWTDEKVERYIIENTDGYKLIKVERNYQGTGKIRVYLKCDKDHFYDVNFDNVQKGRRCPTCNGTIKLTFGEVKTYIEETQSGCVLLSDSYNNIDDDLEFQCYCTEKFKTNFYNFKYNNKRRCNKCRYEELSKKFRSTIEYIAERINELSNGNCTLISEEYINCKTPITLLCGCGTPFNLKYSDFLSNKQYQCPDCGFKKKAESRMLPFEYVKNDIESNGYVLLDNKYLGSDTPLQVKCPVGHVSLMLYNNFMRGARCRQCYLDNMGGENHYAWKGGISPIAKYLRNNIKEWKKESMKSCDYKCVITGKDFNVIHHLYSFNKILEEAIDETGIELLDNMRMYTEEKLEILKNKVIELHEKYGLGVCLTHEVHFLFHSVYGKEYNTPEQFEEFKVRYKNGEFKEVS